MKVINRFSFERFVRRRSVTCIIFEDKSIPGNESFLKRVFDVWTNYKNIDCRIMPWKEYIAKHDYKSEDWVFLINFYANCQEILSLSNPSTTILDALFKTLQEYRYISTFRKEIKRVMVELIPTLYKIENHFKIPEKDYMTNFYNLILNDIKNKENPSKVYKFKYVSSRPKIIYKHFNYIKDELNKSMQLKNIQIKLNHDFLLNNRYHLIKNEKFKTTNQYSNSIIKHIPNPFSPIYLNLSTTKINVEKTNKNLLQNQLQKSENDENLDVFKESVDKQ